MKIDMKEMLREAGLEGEAFYPGKRLVKKYMPHGEHKSHCMVFDWSNSKQVRIELKAGTSGGTLDAKSLHQYPVSFQAPTFLEIAANEDAVVKDEEDEEEEDGTTSASGKGGGGKKPGRQELTEDSLTTRHAFSKMADGLVSTVGEITKFVIMGKEIARDAYAQAYENLKVQLHQTKIMAMDLMKDVANVIQKATPGGGLSPRGDETIKYKYDQERTAPMFGGMTPS